jgi:hypothetical protein
MKALITFFLSGIFCVHFSSAQLYIQDQELEDGELYIIGTLTFEGEPYTGNAIAYYDNGIMKTLREFMDGKYHGIWKEWYNNGELKHIRNYRQDEPSGPWTTYTQTGAIFDEGDDDHLFYSPFFGDDSPADGFEETSPSFTSDGNTMVLARYKEWERKVPYIAYREDRFWRKERLSFVDTLYNLAISPSGERIVYKVFDKVAGEKVSRVFLVDKKGHQWGEPKEVRKLFNLNAGYFHISPDNTLFFFARSPKTGIYMSRPKGKNLYSKPRWLGEALSLPDSDSFDVFVHPQKHKLIVSQYYDEEKYPELGEVGLYFYEKTGKTWIRKNRLPLSYGWGPCITPDRKFVFVRKGGIQYISLDDLGISW